MSVEMNGRRRFNWKVSLTMVEGPTRLSRVVGTFWVFIWKKFVCHDEMPFTTPHPQVSKDSLLYIRASFSFFIYFKRNHKFTLYKLLL